MRARKHVHTWGRAKTHSIRLLFVGKLSTGTATDSDKYLPNQNQITKKQVGTSSLCAIYVYSSDILVAKTRRELNADVSSLCWVTSIHKC